MTGAGRPHERAADKRPADESPADGPLLPTRAPKRTAETAAFWDGCAAGRLVLPRCDECGELIWYPRAFCPFCASTSVTQTDVTGRGVVYSFTVMRQGFGPYRPHAPYVLAIVELDEGPRMMTNLVGVDPVDVTVGLPVVVVFEPVVDDAGQRTDAIPRFRPA